MGRQGSIYLGGGGDETQSAAIDEVAFDSRNYAEGSISCLFIPVALDSRKYDSAKEWFQTNYSDYCHSIDFCFDLYDINRQRLAQYNLIYIGGGDTGRLLNQFKESGLGGLIPEFIESGGFVFGGSAGAILMGKSALTAPEVKETAPHTAGLGCIGNWSVYVHYDDDMSAEVRDLARKLRSNIIAIPEESGAIYDGKLTPIGDGVRLFFYTQ